jgi:peptide/nickel transport system substrate-binding protein
MQTGEDSNPGTGEFGGRLTRRTVLKGLAYGGLLAAGGGALSACGGSAGSPTSTSLKPAQTPKQGGVLRVGLTGGTSSDTLDPDNTINNIDFARAFNLFNSLVEFDLDAQPQLSLAEEVTPNGSATAWTIRVRPDVTWHNGKSLVADDIIYTLRRIADPKSPLEGASQIAAVDLTNVEKLDARTVRFHCHTPFSTFPETLAGNFFFVVPVGFDVKRPVGTGPFKFGSFSPGVQSSFPRFENYWEHPLPYADSLLITEYADETSQLDALQSGQEDVIGLLSPASMTPARASGGQVVVSHGEGWNPFTMRVDVPPFHDNRVRQAMRLIVDREEMLKAVFSGYGTLGNDVFAIFDSTYDQSLPQRHQDIPQAKALLKAAGMEGLHVQLVTSAIAQGVVQSAQVFAQQAQAAGVKVSLNTVTPTAFYGSNYLKWTFAQDVWVYVPYLVQVAQATLPSAPFNECHFNDRQYNSLYQQALATTDNSRRTELIHEMQVIDYTRGGLIIPYFPPVIDAHSPKVHGIAPTRTGLPLSNYGFKSMWLA